MKKTVSLIISICLIFLVVGCYQNKRDSKRRMELAEIKREVYEKAYEEGYKDAVVAVMYELPWYMVDMEELEDSLYEIFDDGEYAEEIRDQITSYCEIYERSDFVVEYSNDGMDYEY
jgi:hypothetical protein